MNPASGSTVSANNAALVAELQAAVEQGKQPYTNEEDRGAWIWRLSRAAAEAAAALAAADAKTDDAWRSATHWRAKARFYEECAEQAEARAEAAMAMLRRLREWDMMDTAADGTYWRHEIDAAIDAAKEKP